MNDHTIDAASSRLASGVSVLFSAQAIAARRRELAAEISRDAEGRELLMVCVLDGAMPFFVDLAREIEAPVSFDTLSVSSYVGTESTGRVRLTSDVDEEIAGRHVLLVEDIVDTGRTLRFVRDLLSSRSPASLRVAVLLDKPERRVVPVEVDYTGFVIPDRFVVGYGLDWCGRYRNLPYIGVLEPSIDP